MLVLKVVVLDEDTEMQNWVRLLSTLTTYISLCRVKENCDLELRDLSSLLLLNTINVPILSPKD